MKNETKTPDDYWNQRAREYGYDLKTLAYGSKLTQERKFDVLISGIKGKRIKILDVGCGFGDLYFHMTQRGYMVDYLGVDVSEQIVKLARKSHPELRIINGDLLQEDLFAGEKFDYVLSTGINCVVHGQNFELEREMISQMFCLCTKGVAIGLQSAIYLQSNPEAASDTTSWYSDPVSLCEYALKNISPWANLRHDYMLHDFTIFLYREPVYP